MKYNLYIRIASVLMFFHLMGHSYGTYSWKITENIIKQRVINEMSNHFFPFFGSSRSLADYYTGNSICVSLGMLLISLLLLILPFASIKEIGLVKKCLYITGSILLIWSLIEFHYFFLFAAANTAMVLVFVGVSLWTAGNIKKEL